MKTYLKRVFFILVLFLMIPFDDVYANSIYGYRYSSEFEPTFYSGIGYGYDFEGAVKEDIDIFFMSDKLDLSDSNAKISLPTNFKMSGGDVVYKPALTSDSGLSGGGPIEFSFKNAAYGKSGTTYDVTITLSNITIERICDVNYDEESITIMTALSGEFRHAARTVMNGVPNKCIGVSYTTTIQISPVSGGEIKDYHMGINFEDLDQPDQRAGVYGDYPYAEGVWINDNELISSIMIPKSPASELQYVENGFNVRIFSGANDDDYFHSSFSAIADARGTGGRGFQYEWSGSGGCLTEFGIIITEPYEVGSNLTVHKCNVGKLPSTCDKLMIQDTESKGSEVIGGYDGVSNLIKRYIPITHNYCMDKVVYIDAYVKPSNTIYDSGYESTSCGKVKLAVPVVIGEDIDLSFGKLVGANGENSVYAGGGFKWEDSNANSIVQKNTLHLNYKFLLNDTDPMFKVEYFYYEKVGDKYNKVNDADNFYRTLGDFSGKIYDDSSCSHEISLDDMVWKGIEDKDYTLDKKFTSVDNNDKNKKKEMRFDVDTEFNNHVMTLVAKLKNAWINRQTAEVSVADKSGDSNYISDGRVWHVPLKYTDGSVFVSALDINISFIKGNSLGFTTNCPIGVKNLVYGDKGIKVRYRPIDISSPFNGKRKSQIESTAENWADWYCGDDDVCNPYDGEINLNQRRISNTYSLYPDSPLYRAIINNENARYISSLDTHYSSFDGINPDGSSDLVRNSSIFIIDRASNASERSFCGLGVYDESGSCDKYRNG